MAACVTQEFLKEHFRYEDGHLYVIKKHASRSKCHVGDKIGYLHPSGRYRAVIHGRKYGLHQLVWIFFKGELPEFGIDHEDRNPGNNRIGNLRECNASTNAQNRIGKGKRLGVNKTYSGKWLAQIGANGKREHLGTFETKEEAIAARDAAELRLHEFSPLKELA